VPNITVTSIVSAVGAPGNFKASVISNNFTQLVAVLNSRGLDSVNYGVSSFLSQHFGNGVVLSDHLGATVVASPQFAAVAVVEKNINRASSDGGVRVLRAGPRADKLALARLTQVVAINIPGGGISSASFRLQFSNAFEGTPGWTVEPTIVAVPGFSAVFPVGSVFEGVCMTAIDSAKADFVVYSSNTFSDSLVAYANALAPVP